MTDAPTPRERKFFALVYPALQAAGYTEYGHQQRLMADTGMNKSTASRLLRQEQIPHVKSFPALAKAIGLDPVELLVAAEILPPEYLESQQTLSETSQSQVGSEGITPEEAAAGETHSSAIRQPCSRTSSTSTSRSRAHATNTAWSSIRRR